jgi:beta-lactamase regulating signal transducer with metallopeptidase domain
MHLSDLQNEMVQSLCWTLLHSLWQGLLIAVITGLVLVLTKRSDAHKRYRLLTGLFILFLVTVTATFLYELANNTVSTGEKGLAPVVGAAGIRSLLLPADAVITKAPQSFGEKAVGYFDTHAYLVVTIWFIFFLFRLIQFGTGLLLIQRLKHYRNKETGDLWKEKMKMLLMKLEINLPVRLLESGLVKIPMVLGVFKPVILVPLGLLSHLPADEAEAILLHELAHIKRRDYLVNLLQSFAETIFFFNPALIWLSSMIRDERENCCDDIAIAVTNNKSKFINALIAFQEYHFSAKTYAPGFPGRKNQLLNRVKRIIHEKNKTLNTMEKSLLSLGMASLLLFSFVSAKKDTGNNKIPVASAIIKAIAPAAEAKRIPSTKKTTVTDPVLLVQSDESSMDTVSPKKELTLVRDTASNDFIHFSTNVSDDGTTRSIELKATTKDGKSYVIRKVNDVLKELSINGEQIPESAFAEHRAEIEKIEDVYQRKAARGRERRLVAEKKRMESDMERKEAIEKKMKMMRERGVLSAEKRKLKAERELELKRIYMDSSRMQENRVEIGGAIDAGYKKRVYGKLKRDTADFNPDRDIKMAKLKRMPDSLVWMKRTRELQQQKLRVELKQQSMKRMREMDEKRMDASATEIRNIAADLEKENVKIDMANGWFALDKDQFIVDGKKMPDALHQKFIEKYIKPHDGWGYYYGPVKVTGRGIFMSYRDVVK